MTDFNDEELDRLEAQLPFPDEHGNLIMWSPTVQMFNKLAALHKRRLRREAEQKRRRD